MKIFGSGFSRLLFFSDVRLINCLRSLRVLLSQPTLAGL